MACTRFWHRGDNNGESESTLEHDMPTSPYLCLNQILSKYFKPHTQGFSLEIHSGQETRKQPLACDTPTVLPMTTKHYQKMSKDIKVMEHKILASGEIIT